MKKPTIREIADYCYRKGRAEHLDLGLAVPLERLAIGIAERAGRDSWKCCVRLMVLWGIVDAQRWCRCQLCRPRESWYRP